MQKIIMANHKMNLNLNDIHEYLKKLQNYKKNIIVFPTSIYLPYFINDGYKVGIQNIYKNNIGAYTGEVSAMQAKKIGVDYVLIGHSERRRLGDNNELIKEKIRSALKNNLTVVLCVGETASERENGDTLKVIEKELSVLEGTDNIIVSYEPEWSIGNKKIPSSDCLKKVVNFIKKCYNVRVLYGGSVNVETIRKLQEIEQLDGYLIGEASLDAEEFIKIIEVAWL